MHDVRCTPVHHVAARRGGIVALSAYMTISRQNRGQNITVFTCSRAEREEVKLVCLNWERGKGSKNLTPDTLMGLAKETPIRLGELTLYYSEERIYLSYTVKL